MLILVQFSHDCGQILQHLFLLFSLNLHKVSDVIWWQCGESGCGFIMCVILGARRSWALTSLCRQFTHAGGVWIKQGLKSYTVTSSLSERRKRSMIGGSRVPAFCSSLLQWFFSLSLSSPHTRSQSSCLWVTELPERSKMKRLRGNYTKSFSLTRRGKWNHNFKQL